MLHSVCEKEMPKVIGFLLLIGFYWLLHELFNATAAVVLTICLAVALVLFGGSSNFPPASRSTGVIGGLGFFIAEVRYESASASTILILLISFATVVVFKLKNRAESTKMATARAIFDLALMVIFSIVCPFNRS